MPGSGSGVRGISTPTRGHRRAARRLASSGLSGAVGAVAVVLSLVLTSTAASPAPPSTTYFPPFTGATSFTGAITSQNGCYHAFLTSPYWNLSNGHGGFATKDNASSCPGWAANSTNTSSYLVKASTSIQYPIALPPNSVSLSVLANLTVNGTSEHSTKINWSCAPLVGVGSSECTLNSQMQFNMSATIVDTTTGQPVTRTIGFFNYVESGTAYSQDNCFNYGCYWSNYSFAFEIGNLSWKPTFSITTTVIPNHAYALKVFVGAFVYVAVTGFVHSKGIVGLNVGTKGHYWSLDSVTVS